MNKTFDVIVIGVGSMGSATCYELARRGLKVLGLERFTVPNEMGSHSGQSRIIRKAYFEHPDYVPLVERAYTGWAALETASGMSLYNKTGLFYAGHPDSILLKGVADSARLYNLKLEQLDLEDIQSRFPAYALQEGYTGLFEPEAGFIVPELAITTLVREATKLGAEIRQREQVTSWTSDNSGVSVTASGGTFHAGKLVITAGPWAGDLIPEIKSKLRVTRQIVAWFSPTVPAQFTAEKFPCWLVDQKETGSVFYGFPMLPPERFGGPYGLKLGLHNPGESSHPDQVNRTVLPGEFDQFRKDAERFLPGATDKLLSMKVCLYTYSPDEHFIIDKLPGHADRVTIAAGFSGHGFKFLPVMGEVLADLSTEGRTNLPAGFLALTRFAK